MKRLGLLLFGFLLAIPVAGYAIQGLDLSASNTAITGSLGIANGGTGGTTQATAQAGIGYPVSLIGSVTNVNCNSLGDNAMNLTLSGTKWRGTVLILYNHGVTASLTAAQIGLFSGTGGSGQAIIGSGTPLTAITATGIDQNANAAALGPASTVVDYSTVQLRITQVQGASCTIDAYLYGYPIP